MPFCRTEQEPKVKVPAADDGDTSTAPAHYTLYACTHNIFRTEQENRTRFYRPLVKSYDRTGEWDTILLSLSKNKTVKILPADDGDVVKRSDGL